jgi:hypothetical protein
VFKPSVSYVLPYFGVLPLFFVRFVRHVAHAGPNPITDPAFHVTRNMEDFITWVDSSKIKRKVVHCAKKIYGHTLHAQAHAKYCIDVRVLCVFTGGEQEKQKYPQCVSSRKL